MRPPLPHRASTTDGPSFRRPTLSRPAPRQTDQPPQQQFQRPPQQQSQQQPQEQAPTGSKTPRRSEAHPVARSFNRMFSGKASYYSYRAAKTAEGLSFDRD